jgi:hypothetical protein
MPLWLIALLLLVAADFAMQWALIARVRQHARAVGELAARPGPGATTDELYVQATSALQSSRRTMIVVLLVSAPVIGAAVFALSLISG